MQRESIIHRSENDININRTRDEVMHVHIWHVKNQMRRTRPDMYALWNMLAFSCSMREALYSLAYIFFEETIHIAVTEFGVIYAFHFTVVLHSQQIYSNELEHPFHISRECKVQHLSGVMSVETFLTNEAFSHF